MSASMSPSESPSLSPSASPSASPSISPSASPSVMIAGIELAEAAAAGFVVLDEEGRQILGEGYLDIGDSVCWGHKSVPPVTQRTIRPFSGAWEGTGTIEGDAGEDNEKIALNDGEYMISEMVHCSGTVTLAKNVYTAGDSEPALYWRTGATPALCEADAWNAYSAPFSSDGYVQVKVEKSACNCQIGASGVPEDQHIYDLGDSDVDVYYAGAEWYDAVNTRQICQVDVNFHSIGAGSVVAKDFYVRIWTKNGGNLGDNVATSEKVTGPSVGTDVYTTFTFATPYTLNADTSYAITVNMEGSDPLNYVHVAYDDAEDLFSYMQWEQWGLNKAEAGNPSGSEWVAKIYWCQ